MNQHNVIRFDVQQFLASPEDLDTFLDTIRISVIEELKAAFPSCSGLTTEMKLPMAFNQIFNATGETFLFIVDEWDGVFRMASDRKDIQKRYLDFLRVLFKGGVYVELAYLTGILPIKKYGEHSAVNIFDEYSMTDPKSISTYFGFTSQEVIAQCQKYDMPFDQMQQWYDGYLLGNAHIYNPKSVADALTWRKFKSYWTGTETYEALKTYIERNFDGLKEAVVEMIGGGSCPVDPTTFQNDMTTFSSRNDILTLLVHLGYLTYNEETGETSIPNQEVRQEFVRSVKAGNVWGSLMDSINSSAAVLERTWALDGETVTRGIEQARLNTSSIICYNDENALSYAIYTAYSAAPAYYFNPIREFPSGKGFADIVYLPREGSNKPALIIELKWSKSAQGALAQIKQKQYAHWIENYTRKILLIGINYDKSTKEHQCIIEEHVKESTK